MVVGQPTGLHDLNLYSNIEKHETKPYREGVFNAFLFRSEKLEAT